MNSALKRKSKSKGTDEPEENEEDEVQTSQKISKNNQVWEVRREDKRCSREVSGICAGVKKSIKLK